jgi:hypothetical protein
LVGYCDEILDATFLGNSDTHLAVASNSPDIKLYRLKDMHCVLLKGHTDLVLSLATSKKSPNLLASTAKVCIFNVALMWLNLNIILSDRRITRSSFGSWMKRAEWCLVLLLASVTLRLSELSLLASHLPNGCTLVHRIIASRLGK